MVSGRRDASAPAGRWFRYRAADLGSGSELLALVALADLHLARLGLLQNRDPDLEDAIVVGGLDGVGVQVLGQGQAAREGTERALADEELVALGVLFGPLDADRQDTAVHGDLDRLRVDAGYVEPQQHVAVAADAVQRHDSGPADSGRAERAPGSPGERVISSQVHPCLTSDWCIGTRPEYPTSSSVGKELATLLVYSLGLEEKR